jgi:hypothetical protein
MKHPLIIAMLFVITGNCVLAQDVDVDNVRDPQARERIRAAHAAYITQRLELTTDEAEKFWPVYREFAEKRRQLRFEMLKQRRSEASDQEILNRDLELKQKELDLEKEYTKKLSDIISPEKLVKLRQAEADFRRLLLKQLQERRRERR